AKEGVIGVPALAPLLWWRNTSRPPLANRIRGFAALTLSAVLFLLLLYFVIGHLSWPRHPLLALDNPLAFSDPWTRIRTAVMILAQNLAICFVPYHFSIDYSYAQIALVRSFIDIRFLLWASWLAVLATAAIAARRQYPDFLRGLSWFVLVLLPAS